MPAFFSQSARSAVLSVRRIRDVERHARRAHALLSVRPRAVAGRQGYASTAAR
jgi:hypothetical protein